MNLSKTLTWAVLTFAAALAAPSALAAEDDSGMLWRFDVALDSKSIGYHTFRIDNDGDRQVLETEASFDVKFLFVTAFRYRHENTEVWNDGCLRSVYARTDSNGKIYDVKGAAKEDSFVLTTNAAADTLSSECVQTFAYWNPEILQAKRLLNTQTGEYEEVSVVLEGYESIAVDGELIEAVRYRLTAKAGDIRLWYARNDNTWLALEAPAKGGRTIRYTPVTVPLLGTVKSASISSTSM